MRNMLELVSCIALFAAVTPLIHAQSPSTARKTVTPDMIDGAKNPELIPDDLAFAMLFSQVCDGRTDWTLDDRLIYLDGSGLSKEQKLIVIDAGNKYKAELSSYGRRFRALPKPRTTAQTQFLKAEMDRRQEEIRSGLESDLRPAGYRKLLAFLNSKVKAETLMAR